MIFNSISISMNYYTFSNNVILFFIFYFGASFVPKRLINSRFISMNYCYGSFLQQCHFFLSLFSFLCIEIDFQVNISQYELLLWSTFSNNVIFSFYFSFWYDRNIMLFSLLLFFRKIRLSVNIHKLRVHFTIIYLWRHRFDSGSTAGPTSEPWTGNFSGSITGPVLKTMLISDVL